MSEELTWEVRHDASAKAYFSWKKDGKVVRSAEFTQSELEAECERLSKAGRDIRQFALALLALSTNGGATEST